MDLQICKYTLLLQFRLCLWESGKFVPVSLGHHKCMRVCVHAGGCAYIQAQGKWLYAGGALREGRLRVAVIVTSCEAGTPSTCPDTLWGLEDSVPVPLLSSCYCCSSLSQAATSGNRAWRRLWGCLSDWTSSWSPSPDEQASGYLTQLRFLRSPPIFPP